jgi:hypothetical protein
MSVGYVYVLANSSMPGLVKVGKTVRLPSERADELSGVTGIPTPFIVVYEEYFEDCDSAEACIHSELMARQLRVSDGREFFRAAASEVVKVGVSVKALSSPTISPRNEVEGSWSLNTSQFDQNRPPWSDLMEEADKHRFGSDGYIEDPSEALKLYRDAARLGSPKAYERLGDMYSEEGSILEDQPKALDCYKEGAKKGNYFCYMGMAHLYFSNRHIENARKAVQRFISEEENDGWKLSRYNMHLHRIQLILMSAAGRNLADRELLSIVRTYIHQVRGLVEKDLRDPKIAGLPGVMELLKMLFKDLDAHGQ